MSEKPSYGELEKRVQKLERAESERKRLEKELAHSNKLLDYIISHARSSIALHDKDLNYLYVSNRYLEEYKVKAKNIIGKHHYEVFPDLPQKWRAVHQRALKGEVLSAEEDPYYREDGSVDWTRWECRPWYDADGSIGGIIVYTEITNDRRNIEEALEKERTFLSAVLDNIQEAIVICDAEGKLLRFNEAARNLHGIGEQPIKSDEWAEHYDLYKTDGSTPLPMEDIPLFKALNQERVQNAEIVVSPGNSKPYFLVCNGQAMRNDIGEVIGAVVAMHDITDRKKAEDRLRDQTKTFNDILEKAADGICVCHSIPEDPYVRFTHWNPRMTEITGYTMEEINQAGWYQSMYPDPAIQKNAIERMANMRMGHDITAEEWIITTKDNKQKALSISTSVIKQENGQTHVMALMQDIDERKHYQNQLLASQREWENIFQAIGQPTIILDPEHGIIKANKAALTLTGLSENQIKGNKCFNLFHNLNEPPEMCPLEALLQKGSLDTVEMQMEALGGTFLVSCTPITDQDGNIEKIIHIATDITKTKELEADLRHAHKMEAVGTLAGGIAHEFNNMLGIIIGNTELAKDNIPEWNPAADCLEEIRNASLRAKDVVRKLLSVARKAPSKRFPLQIGTVVKETLGLLRKTVPSSIKIKQNILCTTETIMADPTEIHQVLINLVTNSQHAIHEETGVIHVSLETIPHEHLSSKHFKDLKPGDHVRLSVMDTGEGIHPDNMDRIFDPYYTTKDVDKGLGMGMAVVNGIVKKHDGAIQIKSKIGKGTTVEVLFPLIEAEVAVEIDKPEILPTGSECILLIDDEPSLLEILTQIIAHYGYDVVEQSSSKEALDLFRSQPNRFDLVITDMAMPNMPGDRLAQEMIQLRPDVPIILSTGHSERIDEKITQELGIKALIMKPFSGKTIAKTIREVLDNARSVNDEFKRGFE